MKYSKTDIHNLQESTESLLKKGSFSKDDIGNLTEVLVFHEYRYYVKNEPLISDYEFDQLFKALQKLEEKHPDFISPISPTQRVGNDLIESFPTVKHTVPMLSLDNSYNAEDLNEFDRRLKERAEVEQVEYVVEPKFDGSSIALLYENDELIRAATRGDGTEGEDVTANVRTISSVPLRVKMSEYGIKKMELRGEIVIRKDVFEAINEKREELGEKVFANSRNAASGALRVKDPKEAKQRGLDGFIYQIGFAEDGEGNDLLHTKLTDHKSNMELLDSLGFKIPGEASSYCKQIEDVIDFATGWEAKREEYNYEIDGMVIKANNREVQDNAGFTAHHPRWAIAYKFKAKQASTKLQSVEFQVGRTGAITPVAKVRPTQLAGVTISSISLHNEDIIKQKDLMIGDTIIIERAGDVIPYVVKSLEELRNGDEEEIQFPENCPVCDAKTERPEGDAVWRCVNADCPAQVEERIIHFVSKDAMDIEGLGKDIVKRFFQLEIIRAVEDIYEIDYSQVLSLEGWGEKSVNKLKNGVEKSKERPAERVLYALGVRHIGLTTAKILCQSIDHLCELKNWSLEQLQELKDIGPKVAQSIYDFYKVDQNISLLEKLEGYGLSLNVEKQEKKSSVLNEQTFLFTGTLEKMGRSEAKRLVEENGGKLLSSVSKNLDYLVAGEKAGSKLKKAESIGSIKIIDEQAFLDMIS